MLDSIIENQLIPLINGGNKGLLKTKTLNLLKVSIPTLYKEQKNIFSDYQNLKSEINNLELKIMNLKGNLSKNFVELNNIT
jgi:ACT domain-containing protein